MAEFEPPSFSLGLDLDCEPAPPLMATQIYPSVNQAPDSCFTRASFRSAEDEEEMLGQQVADSDADHGTESPRVFKRLRRAGHAAERPSSEKNLESVQLCSNGDDEIEDFSSQEDIRGDEQPSTRYHSVCSSSKFQLHGRAILNSQSSSCQTVRKNEHPSDILTSASSEAHCNKLMFPKLTISPLRRFQLLDSDSDFDDPSVVENINSKVTKLDLSSKGRQANPTQYATVTEPDKTQASANRLPNEDLWKDFSPMKSFHVPTPALDAVCEEYFQSSKNKKIVQELDSDACISNNVACARKGYNCQTVEQHWDLPDPIPPAHRYYFHDDSRIKKLVRSRLPNFFPLGVVSRGNMQQCASVIDYMSQFRNGETFKEKKHQSTNPERSSAMARKKSKTSSVEKVSHASKTWVNPKCSSSIPKNAGKRRVHAEGQPVGHWYTGSDGKRVYVSKSGQELTGQIAYRHYKKESGAGFRKSKKKTTAKKRKN